jgi:hypothetical protein
MYVRVLNDGKSKLQNFQTPFNILLHFASLQNVVCLHIAVSCMVYMKQNHFRQRSFVRRGYWKWVIPFTTKLKSLPNSFNKLWMMGDQFKTLMLFCRNPSFGLATKAKGLQGCGPKGSPGVTSGTPGSVGKREGMNPHTPKATPALGDGLPVDSRNFRDRFEGSNLNGLWSSLYQWKALEA